ncbi:benzoate 4-monooxygenase cytochrome P450 [Mariannaea sp. PMI_226]|nr:benzoate 4-monooxygenase cytochrome P450 [Mariannaea sp. PMI_226]
MGISFSATAAASAASAAIALVLVGHVFVSRVLSWHRLRHIQGPRIAAWTDLWLIAKTWQGKTFHELGDVCQKYGPIARIAPNYIVCGDPEEVRRMWSVRSQFDRAAWFKGFRLDPPRDCSLSMRGGAPHAALRSKLSPGYSGRDVSGLHESIDDGIARFVRLIEEKYLSTDTEYRPVDFARKAQYLMLDLMSKIAFGEAFGFMDRDGDLYDYLSMTETSLPMLQMFSLIPWLIDLLQSPFFKAFMPSERDAVGIGPIMATAKRVVGERYGPEAQKRNDMLGSFVKHGLSQCEAESESLVQIIAGSDTTATAFRTTMVHIITNPQVYRRLQGEIDTAICDATLCGVFVPAGTNVAWSTMAVMRNRTVFGVDSEIFRPDRWLLADAGKLVAMQNTVDLCFGQGRWVCLGKPVALIELNKMIVELLRRFDFSIVDAERPVRNSFYGACLQSEMNVRITRRAASI